jgi:hypothetical protein
MTETLHESRRRVLRATGLMALIAAVLTVTVILPAEFGRDPTGFGKLTGLSRLAAVRAASEAAAVPAAGAPAASGTAAAPGAAGAFDAEASPEGKALPLAKWSNKHSDAYATGKYEIKLAGGGELEWKTTMARGEPLLYRWKVRKGEKVYYEFHGEPVTAKWADKYYESYETGEASGGQGYVVAPFSGHHGWYFVNLTGDPVIIDVELVGYYSGFGPVTG